MDKKRILVTGGAGFLGSHLCERLLHEGNEVYCLDNLFTGRKENIVHLLSNPYFEFIRHDVINPFLIEVDEIYNLACPASPIHYQYNPIKTIKTSVMGAINMLGLAKRVKAKILQASTSEVYGNPEVHPQPESYWGNVNPIGERSCYDEGKRAAETLFRDYNYQNNVEIKIVRIFNTYGPRMRIKDGRAIPNFLKQALTGEDLTVYGNGTQTRSFCYVSDLIEGIYRLLMSDKHEPVNIGNPNEMTIQQMADKILQATQSKSKIVKVPLPEDDPKTRQPNITLAKNLLDWEPKVSLDEGLVTTIKYFKEQLGSS